MRTNLFVIILIHFFLAIIFTWPLITHLATLILNLQDGLLINWYLNWSIFHPLNFNANIFYPQNLTLFYSDHMLPQAVLAAPFVKFFDEPLLAYNLNFLFGFILTGMAMYVFTRSLFWSIVFTYNPIHLAYMVHLQLFNFWPVIFAVHFLISKKYKLFILFFLISSLTTSLFFYFLLLICAVFLLRGPLALARGPLLKVFFTAVFVTVPFLVPYFLVSHQFNYVRPITDVIHFSLAPSDLWTQFFPGFIFILIVAITLTRGGLVSARHSGLSRIFFIVAIVSFVLSFGPFLHIFKDTVHIGSIPGLPLPYLIFYYLIPGFSGFRTPSRWILLAFFSIVVFFARSRQNNFRHSGRVQNLLLFLFFLELFLLNYFPLKYHQVPSVKNFPAEQIWLSQNYPDAPIIQFPLYGWWDEPGVKTETLRMYYSTIHWHPMFNGYSGFSPKSWEEKVKWLQKEFPSDQTISYLRDLGIKIVLTDQNINGSMTIPNSTARILLPGSKNPK